MRSRPAVEDEDEEEMAAALTELRPVPTVDATAAVSKLFVGMKRPNLSGLVQHKKPLARRRKRFRGYSNGFDLTSCLAAISQRRHIMVTMTVRFRRASNKKTADLEWLFASCKRADGIGGFLTMNIGYLYFFGGTLVSKVPTLPSGCEHNSWKR